MSSIQNQLPQDLLVVLREGVPALLVTMDAEGYPHTAFTFAVANSQNQIAMVVDEGSTTSKNIARSGKASLQILATENRVYLLKGLVRVRETRLTHSPVPSRRGDLEVVAVKNQAWPEIKVAPLTYEYSERAQTLWREAVPRLYAELRGE